MASIKRFEEIEAWKRARTLTRLIYVVTAAGTFAKDFGLRDQIRRAAVSVMSNIAEGFGRGGDSEFSQFLSMARGSLNEIRAQLYVALDVGYIPQAKFDELYELASETVRLIAGLMSYLNKSELKGRKYK